MSKRVEGSVHRNSSIEHHENETDLKGDSVDVGQRMKNTLRKHRAPGNPMVRSKGDTETHEAVCGGTVFAVVKAERRNPGGTHINVMLA
jgi:hypothetical protein